MLPDRTILDMSCANFRFLLSGIEGGLQEQFVSYSLTTASDATSSANERVAMDICNSIRGIKNARS